MVGFLSAAAVAAWAVSILVVGPLVLGAWVRRRWIDRWLVLFSLAWAFMLVGNVAGFRDPAGLVDLRPEGLDDEWGGWLWALAGAVVLGDVALRGARRARREREIALFLGTYALGYLFQQLAMVAATGQPW